MLNEFIPLTVFFRPAAAEPAVEPPSQEPVANDTSAQWNDEPDGFAETLSAVRRFHAALADALDVAVQSLLQKIASDVLGRELTIKPCDLAAIVASALERHANEDVLGLRVHSQEIGALATLGLRATPDDTLRPGDAVIELRSGTIDMRLRGRLDAVVASLAA